MRKKSTSKFPEVVPRRLQPFVVRMRGAARERYDTVRAQAIAVDAKDLVEKMRGRPEFTDVPDEAIEWIARYAAVLASDSYDDGIQKGFDARQGEINRMAQIEMLRAWPD